MPRGAQDLVAWLEDLSSRRTRGRPNSCTMAPRPAGPLGPIIEKRWHVPSSAKVLGLVGSPNRDGRTFQLVTAALQGAAEAGAEVELVQMADHVVDACKDCLPWTCKDERECAYSDAGFEYLADKFLSCGALVLGTPVYFWDTTAMLRLLILKMFRVYGFSDLFSGLPAVGIGVAGGTGPSAGHRPRSALTIEAAIPLASPWSHP